MLVGGRRPEVAPKTAFSVAERRGLSPPATNCAHLARGALTKKGLPRLASFRILIVYAPAEITNEQAASPIGRCSPQRKPYPMRLVPL